MSIRIHYSPLSQHSRRVRVAAMELGLDIDWRLIDFAKGENRAAEYLQKNPAGKVPTLDDDGLVLWESNAIMAYLADKKPQANLYPTDARARAQVNQWLFWESAHFGVAAITLTWERVMKQAFMQQPADPALAAQGERDWSRYAAILNGQLEGREYVAGALSIADFALASIVVHREAAGIDMKPYRHLQNWVDRMEARESFQKTKPPF